MLSLALMFLASLPACCLFTLLPTVIMQGTYLNSVCSYLDQQLEVHLSSKPSLDKQTLQLMYRHVIKSAEISRAIPADVLTYDK